MNAQNIWAGNDYAFRPDKARAERFTLSAYRVRVRRLVKERLAGNTKASTFVEVQFVNRDTGEPIEYDGYSYSGRVQKLDTGLYRVKAYDFIEHWDNVVDQYHHMIRKQRQDEYERQERNRKAQEEREQREREAAARLENVRNYLIQCGVKPDWIKSVEPYYGIKLDFVIVEHDMQEARKEGSISAQRAITSRD